MDWRARFPGVSEADWRDWRWQLRHALRSEAELARVIDLDVEEQRGLALAGLRTAVTPYYAALMDPHHLACPVRRQAVPLAAEALAWPGDLDDATGEEPHRPTRAVVHTSPTCAPAPNRTAARCRRRWRGSSPSNGCCGSGRPFRPALCARWAATGCCVSRRP